MYILSFNLPIRVPWYGNGQLGYLIDNVLDGGWSTREEMRGQLSCHHLQQDLSTVIVVLLRVLDKAESIDVTHVALPIGPQEV